MKFKVCGMRQPDNIQAIRALQPEWMGFIRYPGSKRYVDYGPHTWIASLSSPNMGRTHTIGVYVNPDIGDIIEDIDRFGWNGIQLHGEHPPSFGMKLKTALHASGNDSVYILRAFGIDMQFDFTRTEPWEEIAQYFIFDTKTREHGGSGRQFDWRVLDKYSGSKPFLLAGGIGPQSVQSLRNFQHPQWIGVDLNSGFECAPGIKNTALLRQFFDALAEGKTPN